METVMMAVAIVKDGDKILLRKMDPARNPYHEPWALFGGRLVGDGAVIDLLNAELSARWNFTVRITDKLWWDEEVKVDADGEQKRFIYLDALCQVDAGKSPSPANENEVLAWAMPVDLARYDMNPPSRTLLHRLGYRI